MALSDRCRPLRLLAAIAVGVLLAACTAPSPQTGADAPTEPAAQTPAPAAASPAPAAPSPASGSGQATLPAKPPRMSTPLPPKRVPERPVIVDRTCQSDADCAVKDVGSCCGYYPACVNKDSRTDPAAVKAQCAASGMASVCGFQEIAACTCSAGTCQAAGGAGAPVAQ